MEETILWLGGDRANEAVVIKPDGSYKWICGTAPSHSLQSQIFEQKAIVDAILYFRKIALYRELSDDEQRLLNQAENELEYLVYWEKYFGRW